MIQPQGEGLEGRVLLGRVFNPSPNVMSMGMACRHSCSSLAGIVFFFAGPLPGDEAHSQQFTFQPKVVHASLWACMSDGRRESHSYTYYLSYNTECRSRHREQHK